MAHAVKPKTSFLLIILLKAPFAQRLRTSPKNANNRGYIVFIFGVNARCEAQRLGHSTRSTFPPVRSIISPAFEPVNSRKSLVSNHEFVVYTLKYIQLCAMATVYSHSTPFQKRVTTSLTFRNSPIHTKPQRIQYAWCINIGSDNTRRGSPTDDPLLYACTRICADLRWRMQCELRMLRL